jgi:hypothetical protein
MSRARLTWVVPGAVVAVGLFAALDALRSYGGEPTASASSPTEAVTTQTETGPDVESSAELQTRRVVRLMPGRVATNERFPIVVTFMVPPGWYGYEDETGFVLGMGLVGEEVDLVPGGITVYVLDSALAGAARTIERVKGIQVKSPVHIGGSLGRRYARRLGQQREVTLNDLGVPRVVPLHPDLILLGAGRKTLVILREFRTDADGAEVNRVLMSFRVTTDEQEIEQLGNRWARLFGAGQRCNRFMGQPVCERIICTEVGGFKIRNCTPLSPKVQRWFADAVVREIVIRGRHAAARFSNGETVRFTEAPWGGSWSIDRVGAGRKLFADG